MLAHHDLIGREAILLYESRVEVVYDFDEPPRLECLNQLLVFEAY